MTVLVRRFIAFDGSERGELVSERPCSCGSVQYGIRWEESRRIWYTCKQNIEEDEDRIKNPLTRKCFVTTM